MGEFFVASCYDTVCAQPSTDAPVPGRHAQLTRQARAGGLELNYENGPFSPALLSARSRASSGAREAISSSCVSADESEDALVQGLDLCDSAPCHGDGAAKLGGRSTSPEGFTISPLSSEMHASIASVQATPAQLASFLTGHTAGSALGAAGAEGPNLAAFTRSRSGISTPLCTYAAASLLQAGLSNPDGVYSKQEAEQLQQVRAQHSRFVGKMRSSSRNRQGPWSKFGR
jgi:hypothetical protein